jgi:hypothetical protein
VAFIKHQKSNQTSIKKVHVPFNLNHISVQEKQNTRFSCAVDHKTVGSNPDLAYILERSDNNEHVMKFHGDVIIPSSS